MYGMVKIYLKNIKLFCKFIYMKDYKKLYLKYKTKYLMAKDGNRIHLDDIMRETLEIYQLVSGYYDGEIYISGSMGLLALAYFIDKNMIPKDYPLPGDIDIVVFVEGRMREIKPKKIGEFSRLQETITSSATFNRSGTNYFNSFDLIATNKNSEHHIINHLGHEIRILSLNEIKAEYIENFDVSEKQENDLRKLDLIEKLEKYDLAVEFTGRASRLEPMTAMKRRRRPDSESMVDLATDRRFDSSPVTGDLSGRNPLARNLFADSDSDGMAEESRPVARSLFGDSPAPTQPIARNLFGDSPTTTQPVTRSLFNAMESESDSEEISVPTIVRKKLNFGS